MIGESLVVMLVCKLTLGNIERPVQFDRGPHENLTCGEDNSPISVIYEGVARIETYPWMGYLYYPSGKKRYTTTVILVTKQVVLANAAEIDKLPKTDFRAKSRVVLGTNCSSPKIAVRDYSLHPEYSTSTYSTLAMVQLETDDLQFELQPICPPPTYFIDPQIFAMTLSDNCNSPVIELYEMIYVNPEACRAYYRKSGLDVSSYWPTHTACARAVNDDQCVWRSGTALVHKQAGKWRLLGFSVYGPGCGAPARFMDYGAFQPWVRSSVARAGRPAVSRLADNMLVLRRSLSNLQRFGSCDPEEVKNELYTDHTSIGFNKLPGPGGKTVRYNVTLYADVEYSCVVFRATTLRNRGPQPKLFLRRWCTGARAMCYDLQLVEIDFYVEITFRESVSYSMKAYGREPKIIHVPRALKYVNRRKKWPLIPASKKNETVPTAT